MKSLLFNNGELVAEKDAAILIKSDGFHNSQSVYSSVRTYNSRPFLLEKHLKRLEESARLVGFQLNASLDSIQKWVMESIRKSDFDPLFLRITATPEQVFIECRPLTIDPDVYDGVKTITIPMVRQLVKAKVVGTPGTLRAHALAQEKGCYEALIVNPRIQCITEGARSNLLWVRSGILYWCDDALSGITQDAVLTLARQMSLEVEQAELAVTDLEHVEEMFLTQTSRGIVPIIQVDNTLIGDGHPGLITESLMKAFDHLTQCS